MPFPKTSAQGNRKMKWKMERRLVSWAFVVAAVILVFVGWESYRYMVGVEEATVSRKQSFEIQLKLDELLAWLVGAETGQRGFVLTGDDAYLQPYREAIKSTDQVISELKVLTAGNPIQQKHLQTLEPIIEKKLAELHLTIELRRNEGFAVADSVVLGGSGKKWMDQIRAEIVEMANEEVTLQQLHNEKVNEGVASSMRAMLAGSLLSISLLVSCFVLLSRGFSERKRAQEALARSEKWFSTTLASVGDAVIATDMNGTVTFMNSVAESLTGWTPEEAAGKHVDLVLEIVNKETRLPAENPVKKALRDGKVAGLADHTLLLSKSGREYDIEDSAAPIVTNASEGLGVVLVFRDITDKKQREEETKRQKELLQMILGSIAEGVVVADLNGKFLLFNAAAEHVLGFGATQTSPDQWSDQYGVYLSDAVTPYPPRQLPLALALRGENVDAVELFVRNAKVPKGCFLSFTGRPLKGPDGALQGGVVVFRDMTERKRAQEALLQSEQRYRLFFDSNPQPVWVYDLKTLAFMDVNPSAVRTYGYSREEFLSMTIKDIRPPEDVAALLESATRMLQDTEFSGVWRHCKKDGTLMDVEITSHPLMYEGRDARLVVAVDITKHKKAENALRESEELFRLLVSEVTDYAILMLDPEGRIVSWNAGAERIKGYRSDEIIGKHFSCFYTTEDLESGKPAHELKVAAELGQFEDTGWRIRKDGSRFWANVVITAIYDKTGCLRGFGKVTRDITERKRTEELLMHAKEEAERANKFKDQFLSTMSHELRTPLNAVLGFSDLLADERYGPLNDRQQRYVSHIHTGGKHLLKLISDILDLSKIEAGRMELAREDVVLASAFSEVISALHPLAEKKSQALLQQVEPRLQVHADAMRIKQILMNLVGNAIKFTPEGGRIELAARQVDNLVRVEVRDNGPGIPLEQQQRIFEAFFRLTQTGSATEGTGLGLAITSRLVELHGSKLGIESLPGEGTCFYFSLPLIASAPDPPVLPPAPLTRARKAPRILVVEDNAVTGRLIQSQLTSSGYETLKCDHPEHAVGMAAEHMPDAITLDLLMHPVHGLEVLLQLKNDPRTSKIPVIVVTIVDQPGVGTALGADEYLIKPVDKATLLAAVERCLQSRGGAAPARSILVVEDDESTLEMIVELLKGFGHAVSTATDGAQARASVAQSLPELVILDLVLPKMSGFDLLAEWRSNPRTADLSVFVLTSKDLTKEEEKYVHAHAESLFRKQNSWREPLIKQLERVVTSPVLEVG
jgi:PAS domain S-box-containing protein